MTGISTVAIHADRDVHPSRSVARPIYQTAAFWAEDGPALLAALDRGLQSPEHAAFVARLAQARC